MKSLQEQHSQLLKSFIRLMGLRCLELNVKRVNLPFNAASGENLHFCITTETSHLSWREPEYGKPLSFGDKKGYGVEKKADLQVREAT